MEKNHSIIPSMGQDLPEVQLKLEDNQRVGFFVSSDYFPLLVDEWKMKSSLQRLLDCNPELCYRFIDGSTMGYLEGFSNVPFVVVHKTQTAKSFQHIHSDLSQNPGNMLEHGLMKKYVNPKHFFVGNFHQYFGNGKKAKITPAFALQLTYDADGGTWITRWHMHNFGDGSSAARIFFDLVQGYQDSSYKVPRYNFQRSADSTFGWDTSEFPTLLRRLFGCCSKPNTWRGHRRMYSPVRLLKQVLCHDMSYMRYDVIGVDQAKLDDFKKVLQSKVSVGDILGGMIWMALSLTCKRKHIGASLVKDKGSPSEKTFQFGNEILDVPLDPVDLEEDKDSCSNLFSKFVLAVRNGRVKDHSSISTLSQMKTDKPVLSISNMIKLSKLHRSYATLDNVPMKARYTAVLAETMPTFSVLAWIDNRFMYPDQYSFLIFLPTNLKPKLENELSKIHKSIFLVKDREENLSLENPQAKSN